VGTPMHDKARLREWRPPNERAAGFHEWGRGGQSVRHEAAPCKLRESHQSPVPSGRVPDFSSIEALKLFRSVEHLCPS
jgi:hypothetical protein